MDIDEIYEVIGRVRVFIRKYGLDKTKKIFTPLIIKFECAELLNEYNNVVGYNRNLNANVNNKELTLMIEDIKSKIFDLDNHDKEIILSNLLDYIDIFKVNDIKISNDNINKLSNLFLQLNDPYYSYVFCVQNKGLLSENDLIKHRSIVRNNSSYDMALFFDLHTSFNKVFERILANYELYGEEILLTYKNAHQYVREVYDFEGTYAQIDKILKEYNKNVLLERK